MARADRGRSRRRRRLISDVETLGASMDLLRAEVCQLQRRTNRINNQITYAAVALRRSAEALLEVAEALQYPCLPPRARPGRAAHSSSASVCVEVAENEGGEAGEGPGTDIERGSSGAGSGVGRAGGRSSEIDLDVVPSTPPCGPMAEAVP